MVNRAKAIEFVMKDTRDAFRQDHKKRGRENENGKKFKSVHGRFRMGPFQFKGENPGKRVQPSHNMSIQSIVNCNTCGGLGHRASECRKSTGACFRCGKMGHRIASCPQLLREGQSTFRHQANRAPSAVFEQRQNHVQNSNVGSSGTQQKAPTRSQVPARVYALTEPEANASHTVVTGLLYVGNHHAYVLFDTDATHSFISASFVRKYEFPYVCLRDGLLVDTPASGQILSNKIVKHCPVLIEGRTLYADLFVLTMSYFDVIFGIDWLSSHYEKVDCRRKEVHFGIEEEEPFFFRSYRNTIPLQLVSAQ